MGITHVAGILFLILLVLIVILVTLLFGRRAALATLSTMLAILSAVLVGIVALGFVSGIVMALREHGLRFDPTDWTLKNVAQAALGLVILGGSAYSHGGFGVWHLH